MALERFFRIADVLAMSGMPRSSLYRAINAGSFPRPVQIGPRAVAWREVDIASWQEQRIRMSKRQGEDKQ